MASPSRRIRGSRSALLQYADTERNADQFFFGGFQVPDPFISLEVEGEKIGFFTPLEIGRAGRESRFDAVLSLDEWRARAGAQSKGSTVGPADVVLFFCREKKIRRVRVGADFPAGMAFRLKEGGLGVEVAEGMLFPAREFKTDAEAAAIAYGNRCSAAGIRAAERVLRASRIRGRDLIFEGLRLTSERVRLEIEKTCLELGAISQNTIVAGGVQGCDPHCRGSGPLRAHELIIIDVFPRVTRTGFHGDLTRTFLKGRPSDAQKDLVGTVRESQKIALRKIKAGVKGSTVHAAVTDFFNAKGYTTREEKAGPVGFFHGTGHGLGLEVHEPPRISPIGPRLKKNQVVTVEPGLYYPEVGGCRIEDVARVQSDGIEMLSKLHYRWHIR